MEKDNFMSLTFYGTHQLPFWNSEEILFRNVSKELIVKKLYRTLTNINPAWKFEEVEGPLLTPQVAMSSAYTAKDIWITDGKIGEDMVSLRAETTQSSYLYLEHLLNGHNKPHFKAPLCVYQCGKSFRKEANEGASASKLRFFEFYQLEFQCLYSIDTGADYVHPVIDSASQVIGKLTNLPTRAIPSDRLPYYSDSTMDVEIQLSDNVWREMASISQRHDFPNPKYKILEVAIGLDRIVSVSNF